MINQELYNVFQEWANRTVEVLRQQIKSKNIKETDALLRSLSTKLSQQTGGVVSAQFWFNTYGRFVDMGAGRRRKAETQATNRAVWKSRGRKPKKWYSRPIHARIHRLREIVTLDVAEIALKQVLEELNKAE